MRFKSARAVKGMTLVEILIVISLMAMICAAIYQSLAGGLRVWQQSQRLIIEEDVIIFLEKLTADLHNAFVFSLIPCEGKESDFSFPTIVRISANENSSEAQKDQQQIGRVEYSLNYEAGTIIRRQSNFGQAFHQTWTDPQVIVSGVSRLIFRYHYISGGEEIISPQTQGALPYGVNVEVYFSDQGVEKKINRFISVPVQMM